MNCTKCEYPLWNLKARTCPECNTPFAPSQFTFRPHSVAFCCPRCDQPYYGTGEGGHLDPRAFTCIKCGQALHEDEMVLRPGPGVQEERTRHLPVPWLDPRIRSTTLRLAQTSLWALFTPYRLGSRLPTPERPWAALGFASVAVLVMLIPAIAMAAVLSAMMPAGPGSSFLALGFVTLFFGIVLVAIVAVVPWAVTAHIALGLSGEHTGGFGRTLACVAYGIPACIPMAIPVLGIYFVPVALVYWTVVTVIILRAGQRVTWGRALVAAGVLPLLVALGVGLFIGLVVVPGYRSVTATIAAMKATTTPAQQASTLSSAVLTHARLNAGAGPEHMSELWLSGAVRAPDLLSGQRYRNDARASIGRTNMSAVESLLAGPGSSVGSPTTETVRSDVKAVQPASPITSHRLGDAVFTYHAINLLAPPDPGLWILVLTPEPSPFAVAMSNASASPSGSTPTPPPRPALAVAKADGTVQEIPDADFGAALDAQNALRTAHALPALPDPRKLVANGFTTPADAPRP
jgi:hypothetical protein